MYSEKWISENLDFPTLLNKFYIFRFTDYQSRWEHVGGNQIKCFLKNNRYKRERLSKIAVQSKTNWRNFRYLDYYNILEQYNVVI